ncbi:MAG: glycosyltransferase [Bryobacteraceae bacterium]
MRILHIGKFYPPRHGGMETAIKDICECIAAKAEVRAVVANHAPGEVCERVNGVELHRLRTPVTLASQPVSPGMWAAIRRSPADIVHLHEPNPLAMASFLASGHRGRLIVHYHSDIVRQKQLARAYAPILERGLARASAIVAGSRELVASSPVLSRWREKCVVIPFGIDLDPFLRIGCCDRRGRGRVRVLAVGRLSYYKGFQYLIEAARPGGFEVVIAGEGEMRPALEQRIAACGVTDRVRLAGRVTDEQLHRLYAESDLFCLSSCERSEAFGLVQIEAMAAGLPVVSTDLPTGVRSINRHGETGLVVPPHNAAALASAIGELAADRERRARMGSAARQRAEFEYDRRVMAARIARLYEAVLGAGAYEGEAETSQQDLSNLQEALTAAEVRPGAAAGKQEVIV